MSGREHRYSSSPSTWVTTVAGPTKRAPLTLPDRDRLQLDGESIEIIIALDDPFGIYNVIMNCLGRSSTMLKPPGN